MTFAILKQIGKKEKGPFLPRDPVFLVALVGAALASLVHVKLVRQLVEVAMVDTPHRSSSIKIILVKMHNVYLLNM